MSEQLDFDFGGDADTQPLPDSVVAVPDIPGLKYLPQFLPISEQEAAIQHIDQRAWRSDLERRVQHYGWRYDYRARTVDRDMHIGPLPEWLQEVAIRLYDETHLFDHVPDQAIVNEYLPGQGIAMHSDRQCFGPTVATVSLCDAWRMDLRPARGKSVTREQILLEEGSALLMSGEARWRWLHGIAKRKTERTNSGSRLRQRRVSLTFRTVLSELHIDGQTLSAG